MSEYCENGQTYQCMIAIFTYQTWGAFVPLQHPVISHCALQIVNLQLASK